MILFLYGPDTYRSGKKLKEIISRYKEIHKSGMSFHALDADTNSFGEFRNATGASAMFAEKKLVVAKGFLGQKEFAEKFMAWVGREHLKDNKDVICVFYEGGAVKKEALANWFMENAEHQEFEILNGMRLNKWAQDLARQRQIKISQGAVFRLCADTRGDLWALENQIQKLRVYKNGEEIGVEDVDIFLKPREQTYIFSLTDAFIGGNRPKAFRMLNAHIEAGDNENYIFYMVCGQFRRAAQARRFNGERIKKIYNKLVDLDIGIKTGKVEPRAALETLILADF